MKMTTEFKGNNGTTITVLFDLQTRTATMNGQTVPFTQAEGSNVIKIEIPGRPLSVTLESMSMQPGATTPYSTSEGETGIAKILSIG